LKIEEEELDKSLFFLELIEAVNPSFKEDISGLYKEGNELLAIVVSSITTMRNKV
jgi:hypothetical protein